jgi:peptide/nickel transport system substrate-binding protein
MIWVSIQDGMERTFDSNGWYAPNQPGFANQDYDRACGIAWSSLPGQPEYEEARYEVQRIFAEQLPVVPLFLRPRLAVARPDICGLIVDPTGGELWNLAEFDYGEGCEG